MKPLPERSPETARYLEISMLAWHRTSEIPAPTDRIFLASSGLVWEREDWVEPTRRGQPGRQRTTLKQRGSVVTIYWATVEMTGLRHIEGVWALAGTASIWSHPFDFWADFNNPLASDRSAPYELIRPNPHELPVPST
jgi:hypothetical protein